MGRITAAEVMNEFDRKTQIERFKEVRAYLRGKGLANSLSAIAQKLQIPEQTLKTQINLHRGKSGLSKGVIDGLVKYYGIHPLYLTPPFHNDDPMLPRSITDIITQEPLEVLHDCESTARLLRRSTGYNITVAEDGSYDISATGETDSFLPNNGVHLTSDQMIYLTFQLSQIAKTLLESMLSLPIVPGEDQNTHEFRII